MSDFFDNPHPILAELRERGGLSPDATTGSLISTSHGDVCAILKHRELSKDPRKLPADDPLRAKLVGKEPGWQPNLLFLDPPDHTRLRALVTRAFTPRRIETLAPRIETMARALLDGVAGRASFDLLDALARPLPIQVIGELIGVDVAAVPAFADWCKAMSHELNPMAPPEALRLAAEARAAFDAHVRASMDERRQSPRDDLLTALLEAGEAGDRLSEAELVSMCRILLLAGNITTTDAIANGVLALLDHPAELARLRADRGLIDRAVEEMLRYDSSVTGVGRNVVERPVEVAGRTMPPGTRLHASLAGANRDPAVFPEPDRFMIERDANPHVAFGGGIHFCLGAPLARLEMKLAIGMLVERFPRIRLAVPRQSLEWQRIVYFRALKQLPIAVD